MPDIPYAIRNLHVNIVGNIGMGKSTLITSWALWDIKLREGGVCLIDPKGDLVNTIMRFIPDDRVDDCIWIDIEDNPVPLDFMRCAPRKEDGVVSDLKYMLMGANADMAQYPNLNRNIENLLRALIDANTHPFLNKPENRKYRCVFLDVYEFLENKERREFIRAHLSKPTLIKYWEKLPTDADRDKILSRINPYVQSDTLSQIFGEPDPKFDIHEVIQQKKILLVSVPVENHSSAAYGKFLMAKVQHAAFSVRDERRRLPFFLYVDEFQNFPTSEDFERVIDMGRGYLLCFTLSITRLEKLTQSMRSAIGGLGSYVVLQLNPEDAGFYQKRIEKNDPNKHLRDKLKAAYLDYQLSPSGEPSEQRAYDKWKTLKKMVADLPEPLVTIQDAIDLPRFHAIYKIGFEPAVIEPIPDKPSDEITPDQLRKIERIKANSRKYATPAQSSPISTGDKSPSNSPQVRHTEGNGNNTPTDEPSYGLSTDNILPSHESKKRKP